MADILFRCSSVGKLMTEPRSKSEGPLSKGAKTYIRRLVAEDIFGVEFEFTSKETDKGIRMENDSISLLNRVLGLDLVKNSERRSDKFLTGEADLFHAPRRAGYDTKTAWSLATFPILSVDVEDQLYEYQARGYMRLWDADEWTVAYAMVNTPDDLIRHESQSLHFVDHIPEQHRLTTWTIKRDMAIEVAMLEKIKHAQTYYCEVAREFQRTHPTATEDLAAIVQAARATPVRIESTGPAEIPESIFG